MDAYNCQYIETTLGVPHKGEGLRVGRGDILILGLWIRDRIISANLGPERLLSSLAAPQPFFSPQHAFSICTQTWFNFLIFHFCFIPGRKSTPVMAKISLLTQRQKQMFNIFEASPFLSTNLPKPLLSCHPPPPYSHHTPSQPQPLFF